MWLLCPFHLLIPDVLSLVHRLPQQPAQLSETLRRGPYEANTVTRGGPSASGGFKHFSPLHLLAPSPFGAFILVRSHPNGLQEAS